MIEASKLQRIDEWINLIESELSIKNLTYSKDYLELMKYVKLQRRELSGDITSIDEARILEALSNRILDVVKIVNEKISLDITRLINSSS